MIVTITILTVMVMILFFIVMLLLFKILTNPKSKQTSLFITNFKGYHDALFYFLDKAYDVIYKKCLYLYSIEGYSTSNEDMKQAIKDYDELVIKLMGAPLANEYIELMGKETFFFTINQYMNERFENDELKSVFSKDTPEE